MLEVIPFSEIDALLPKIGEFVVVRLSEITYCLEDLPVDSSYPDEYVVGILSQIDDIKAKIRVNGKKFYYVPIWSVYQTEPADNRAGYFFRFTTKGTNYDKCELCGKLEDGEAQNKIPDLTEFFKMKTDDLYRTEQLANIMIPNLRFPNGELVSTFSSKNIKPIDMYVRCVMVGGFIVVSHIRLLTQLKIQSLKMMKRIVRFVTGGWETSNDSSTGYQLWSRVRRLSSICLPRLGISSSIHFLRRRSIVALFWKEIIL